MLEKIESKRRRGQQRMRWLDSITDSMHINVSILWEVAKNKKAWCQWGCSPWGHKESNAAKWQYHHQEVCPVEFKTVSSWSGLLSQILWNTPVYFPSLSLFLLNLFSTFISSAFSLYNSSPHCSKHWTHCVYIYTLTHTHSISHDFNHQCIIR